MLNLESEITLFDCSVPQSDRSFPSKGRLQICALNYRFARKNNTLSIPVSFTSSAEIDRSTYGSSTLQRAGIQPLADVQVTHLKQEGKGK